MVALLIAWEEEQAGTQGLWHERHIKDTNDFMHPASILNSSGKSEQPMGGKNKSSFQVMCDIFASEWGAQEACGHANQYLLTISTAMSGSKAVLRAKLPLIVSCWI